MKRITTLLCILLISGKVFSQGYIQGFTVVPASPTTSDNVIVYVDLMFSSSGCAVANQGHSTTGGVTDAYAHHCMGMLSTICNTVDTFNLGMLSAGPHVFRFTLSSGFGGPPCSPGIVPDGMDSVNFSVSPTVGIDEAGSNPGNITVSPNPFHSAAMLTLDAKVKLHNAELQLTDILGKTVRTIKQISSNEIMIQAADLPKGIYFYRLNEAGRNIGTGKLIIE